MPKRIVPLSDAKVKNSKPKDADYKLADGFGLYLLVTPTGGKLWRLDYRFNQKRKTMALGVYPTVSLADARQRRDDAKRLLDANVDPSEVKKAQKEARHSAGDTFEAVAREWYKARLETWSENTARDILGRLEYNVFPVIGKTPINTLRPPDLLSMFRKIEERGAITSSRRCAVICSQIYGYAVASGRAERNVILDIRGALVPAPNGNLASITDPKGVAALLRAIDGYQGSHTVRLALLLAPLVFVRPGELRNAEWSEIDLNNAEWNIPAEKMKMRKPHLVPLSRQAVAVLKELHQYTEKSRYVFPSGRTFARPMSANTVNAALRSIGYDGDMITGHGFRAMARTIMDEILRIRPDFIEHQLAHTVKDPNGRADRKSVV